jgi:hypothetical protein
VGAPHALGLAIRGRIGQSQLGGMRSEVGLRPRADWYREKARQARKRAERIGSGPGKEAWLDIERQYEQLAGIAEMRRKPDG